MFPFSARRLWPGRCHQRREREQHDEREQDPRSGRPVVLEERRTIRRTPEGVSVMTAGGGDERTDHDHDAEARYRAAIADGDTAALASLGLLLADQPGREDEAEAAYREAIAAGDTGVWNLLGTVLAELPGREGDAEHAYREAHAAGSTVALNNLGSLLHEQPDRFDEAQAAYRQAIAAGYRNAWYNLGLLLHKRGGHATEAEHAYREALAAGDTDAWFPLGLLLTAQPGRLSDAAAAYRGAADAADTPAEQERATLSLGDVLVRLGDKAGARAAYEMGIPLAMRRMTAEAGFRGMTFPVAPMARIRIAINRRLRTRRAIDRLNEALPMPPGVSRRPPYRDG